MEAVEEKQCDGEGVREGGVGEDEGGRKGDEGPLTEAVGERGSQERDTQPVTVNNSRYLDNDSEPQQKKKKKTVTVAPPPTKRLTRAERARQEALASFGGTDLASVAVKKRDLREELHRDSKNQQHTIKTRTRMQNSSDGIKDALFGERAVSRKRRLEEPSGVSGSVPEAPKAARRMTKAERARLDALQSFGGCGFDDVMATSRKKIAKTFEMKEEKEKEGEAGEGEGEKEGEGEGMKEGEGVREGEGEGRREKEGEGVGEGEGVKVGEGVKEDDMCAEEEKENIADLATVET